MPTNEDCEHNPKQANKSAAAAKSQLSTDLSNTDIDTRPDKQVSQQAD